MVAPGYRVNTSAQRIAKMDSGITGKAGMLPFFTPRFCVAIMIRARAQVNWSSAVDSLSPTLAISLQCVIDPFFEIRCRFQIAPGQYTRDPLLLYRSEFVKQNLNPKWNDFEINMDLIGDIDNRISPF